MSSNQKLIIRLELRDSDDPVYLLQNIISSVDAGETEVTLTRSLQDKIEETVHRSPIDEPKEARLTNELKKKIDEQDSKAESKDGVFYKMSTFFVTKLNEALSALVKESARVAVKLWTE